MHQISWVIGIPLVAGLWAAGVAAAQPPGHPSVEGTTELLGLPQGEASYVHTGRVLEAIDGHDYTYILVKRERARQWLVAPKVRLWPGQMIRFPDGALMPRFYSKALQRTFENLLFVSGVIAALEKT